MQAHQDHKLPFNPLGLDWRSKPLLRRLLEYLAELQERREPARVDELLAHVYQLPPFPCVSHRLWESARQRLTKLLSRARLEIQQYDQRQFGGKARVEWLPYDHRERGWRLWRCSGKPAARQGQSA